MKELFELTSKVAEQEVGVEDTGVVKKDYLGSRGDEHFYLVRKENASGGLEDLVAQDAEDKELVSAKAQGIDILAEKEFILFAMQALDLDRVGYEVLMKYFAEENQEGELVKPEPSLPVEQDKPNIEEPAVVDSSPEEVPVVATSVEEQPMESIEVLRSKYFEEELLDPDLSFDLRTLKDKFKLEEQDVGQMVVPASTGIPIGSKVVSPQGEEFLVIDSKMNDSGLRKLELFSLKLNGKAGSFTEPELRSGGWQLPQLVQEPTKKEPEVPEFPKEASKVEEPILSPEPEVVTGDEPPVDAGVQESKFSGQELRLLTDKEIDQFVDRAGVKKIAVENFLGSLEGMNAYEAGKNAESDAKVYRWNKETLTAITDGIRVASAPVSEAAVKVKG